MDHRLEIVWERSARHNCACCNRRPAAAVTLPGDVFVHLCPEHRTAWAEFCFARVEFEDLNMAKIKTEAYSRIYTEQELHEVVCMLLAASRAMHEMALKWLAEWTK